jgi:hypothetical protein
MEIKTPTREVNTKCPHPFIRKGYYLGIEADVFICVTCGEQRPAELWEDFELRRTPPRGTHNGEECPILDCEPA